MTVVRPAGPGEETRLVLAASLLTLLVCAGVVYLRNVANHREKQPDWQVNAFTDLRPAELAVFNDLYNSAPDIEMMHEDDPAGAWPTVDDLADELLPPFVRDGSREGNGAMAWTRTLIVTPGKHMALYVGHPGDAGRTGTFLLLMLHDHTKREGNAKGGEHPPFEVWLHASPSAEIPTMITDLALINRGWRVVEARRGEDDMKNSKGDYLK